MEEKNIQTEELKESSSEQTSSQPIEVEAETISSVDAQVVEDKEKEQAYTLNADEHALELNIIKLVKIRGIISLIIFAIALAAGIVTLVFLGFEFLYIMLSILIVVVLSSVGSRIFLTSIRRKIAVHYSWIEEDVYNSSFNGVKFDVRELTEKTQVDATYLIKNGNEFFEFDKKQGNYKDIPFFESDITVNNSSENSFENYFKGVWTTFELSKDIIDYVKIIDKEYDTDFDFGTPESILFKTGDSSFDNKYTVYAQDPDIAKKLFSQEFIENLKQLMKTDGIAYGHYIIGIIKNKIHILLNGENIQPKNNVPAFRVFITKQVEHKTDFIDYMETL